MRSSNSTNAEEFAQHIPSATSRCTSPSSSWWGSRSACSVRGYRPFASTFAAFLTRAYDFIRMAAISQGQHLPGRLARGRRDRRRRPVADGAGGPGHDACRPGLDRALPVRRHQHGCARAGHGRPARASSTCARPAVPIRCCTGRRKLPDRRGQGAARQRRGSSDPDRGGRDPACLPSRCRPARPDGISARVIDVYSVKPIDTETLTAAAAQPAAGSWSPRIITPRAASGPLSWTR